MRQKRRALRAALAGNAQILATFLLIPRLEVVEMLGLAGFDAVVIDLEHGPISLPNVQDLAAAAQGAGMYAVARVGGNSEAEIGRVLDAGVDGILVPHVASTAEATQVVKAGRFPPIGERSINPYVRGNVYGADTNGSYIMADETIAIMAMLEGVDDLDKVSAICDVEGLDGVFIGPVDLAASLGLAGEAEHPKVTALVGDVIERVSAAKHGIGVYAPTPERAAEWFRRGASLVAMSADSAMASRAFTSGREGVRRDPETTLPEEVAPAVVEKI